MDEELAEELFGEDVVDVDDPRVVTVVRVIVPCEDEVVLVLVPGIVLLVEEMG